MALQTWVARFVVDHGRVTEEGGLLRSFQRRRLDEPEVDLHVLAVPEGAKGDDLGGQALDAIGRLFLQDRLSLTGGLMRALSNTHQTLLDWNRRSVPRDQVSVGIVAAIVSGAVVYLAQAGAALVYVRRGGRFQRLDVFGAAAAALGEDGVDPELRRFELAPGDLLIAASPALASVADEARLEALLARGGEEALPELYLLTKDLPSFCLFAVTWLNGTDDDSPSPVDLDEPPSSAARGLESVDGPITEHSTQTLNPPHERSSPRATLTLTSPPDAPANGTSIGHNGSTAVDVPLPEAVMTAPKPLDISRPVVRLRNDQGVGRTDYTRTTGARSPLGLGEPRMFVVLAAAAVVLLIGAMVVPDLIRENRSERLGTLLVTGQTTLSAALSSDNQAERRRLFEETRRLAAEALRIDHLSAIATELHVQASTNLQVLDAVLNLGPMTSVTTLSRQITGEVQVTDVALGNGHAYLLDAKGGRIIGVPLAVPGAPTIVFQEGDTYGGIPARRPSFLVWQGPEPTGRLLVLDGERKLFELRAGTAPVPLQLRRTNAWTSVAGLATYADNLYVLDPAGDQVHRYLPASAGFDSEPTDALAGQSDLADATRIAVDGDIYVSLKDGRVRRFRSGQTLDFPLKGIDRSPKVTTGLAVVPDAEEVYIADAGNKRIVVVSRDGVFRRQLVSSAITDLQAMALSPVGGQLYVVVDDALLTAPIIR